MLESTFNRVWYAPLNIKWSVLHLLHSTCCISSSIRDRNGIKIHFMNNFVDNNRFFSIQFQRQWLINSSYSVFFFCVSSVRIFLILNLYCIQYYIGAKALHSSNIRRRKCTFNWCHQHLISSNLSYYVDLICLDKFEIKWHSQNNSHSIAEFGIYQAQWKNSTAKQNKKLFCVWSILKLRK